MLLPSTKQMYITKKGEKDSFSRCRAPNCLILASTYTNRLCSKHIVMYYREGCIEIHPKRGIEDSFEVTQIYCDHSHTDHADDMHSSRDHQGLNLNLRTDGGPVETMETTRPTKETSLYTSSELAVSQSGCFYDVASLSSSDLSLAFETDSPAKIEISNKTSELERKPSINFNNRCCDVQQVFLRHNPDLHSRWIC